MIRVFVSYSKSEAVTFSFWKHFFQICGIWVTENALKGDDIEFSNEPHLFILGNEDIGCVKEQLINQHVYIVKDNAKYKSLLNKKRPDIFSIKRWDEKMPFAKVITALFNGKQATAIRELLEIYIETNLWEISWLFHEFAIYRESNFDNYISLKCKKVLSQLNIKKEGGWNYEYMKLYIQYMLHKVMDRSLYGRMTSCQELLICWQKLEEKKELNPNLYLLKAQISEMSPIENKSAINYYLLINEYEKQSDILYRIGHLFETIYGNDEAAEKYYRKSYKCDASYYRAWYKIALYLEKRGEWIFALNIYYKIRKRLSKSETTNAVSTFDIDYYYKCCKRIIKIYYANICDNDTIIFFENELEQMHNKIMNDMCLNKLMNCMIDKESFESQRSKILKEIDNRLIDCFGT